MPIKEKMLEPENVIQTNKISQFKIWFLATRPKTLSISCTPIFLGTFLAVAKVDFIHWNLALLALICACSIQIGINLVNDAIDFKKGADREGRLGPLRVTQSGLLSYKQVLRFALVCFLFAILFGIPLILTGGWPLFWALFASIIFGYLYTGGPFPLAYWGLGEVFVLIFFGYVITCSAFYLQTGFVDSACLLGATQIGLLAMITIAINNTRDMSTDLIARKMTLSVRLGLSFSRYGIMILSGLPYLLGLIWMWQRKPLMGVLPFLVFHLIYKNAKAIWENPPSSLYNEYLARSAKNQLLFGVLLITGYLIEV